MKNKFVLAVVLVIGIASGVILPKVVQATWAWAGGCEQQMCWTQTTAPSVMVWIADGQKNKYKLKANNITPCQVGIAVQARN